MKVIKAFRDKDNLKNYPIGSVYENKDEQRVIELQSKGFLENNEDADIPEGIQFVETLLDQNANTVIDSIKDETDKETLEILLKSEIEGKNRTTVIKHIDSLLKGDENESSEVKE